MITSSLVTIHNCSIDVESEIECVDANNLVQIVQMRSHISYIIEMNINSGSRHKKVPIIIMNNKYCSDYFEKKTTLPFVFEISN